MYIIQGYTLTYAPLPCAVLVLSVDCIIRPLPLLWGRLALSGLFCLTIRQSPPLLWWGSRLYDRVSKCLGVSSWNDVSWGRRLSCLVYYLPCLASQMERYAIRATKALKCVADQSDPPPLLQDSGQHILNARRKKSMTTPFFVFLLWANKSSLFVGFLYVENNGPPDFLYIMVSRNIS